MLFGDLFENFSVHLLVVSLDGSCPGNFLQKFRNFPDKLFGNSSDKYFGVPSISTLRFPPAVSLGKHLTFFLEIPSEIPKGWRSLHRQYSKQFPRLLFWNIFREFLRFAFRNFRRSHQEVPQTNTSAIPSEISSGKKQFLQKRTRNFCFRNFSSNNFSNSQVLLGFPQEYPLENVTTYFLHEMPTQASFLEVSLEILAEVFFLNDSSGNYFQ